MADTNKDKELKGEDLKNVTGGVGMKGGAELSGDADKHAGAGHDPAGPTDGDALQVKKTDRRGH